MKKHLNEFLMRDVTMMKAMSNTISRHEDKMTDEQLRFYIYRLGVYAYRSYLGMGEPEDLNYAGKKHATKLWSSKDELPLNKKMLQKV